MTVAGDPAGASNGIVRFNITPGTATRFFQGTDFIDVNVGLDGKVYALTSNAVLYSFDPNSMGLLGTLTLPAGHDYRGVAVNQTGEIFTANWDNSASHFTAGGALIATVNLTGPNDGSWFGNPLDIKVASDGTLAMGTRSGQAVQMTSSFTNISYIHTWVGSVQYPCFVNFAPTSSPSQPTVSIGNYSALEGNSGTTPFTFTVTLSAASSQSITVYYSTANGTATSGSDYQAVSSGSVTFAPGQTSQTITISVYGDTTLEPDETFTVKLTGVTGNAMLGQTTGTGTIRNDDLPTITIYNQGIYEGSSGSATTNFTVYLSAASTQTVTVNYATADGTATAGSDYTVTVNYATAAGTATAGTDYQSLSGTLSFAPGQTSKTVTVYAIGDTLQESNETFTLNLSGATNATISRAAGTGTIVNEDFPVISVAPASLVEGNSGTSYMAFTLSLSASSPQTISVNYATGDIVSVGGGGPIPATAGVDYQATSGTATFAPGQTTATVLVPIYGDKLVETDEAFGLGLSNPVNVTLSALPGNYGTILNDDHAPVANAGPNQTVNEGATVTFDGSGSSDADGDALSYFWSFGDGSGASGVNPTHVFADNGVYTVTLTISDGANTSSSTLTVTVQNVAPTLAVSGPTDAVPGQDRTIAFSATDPSSADQAGQFTYQITWGDGTTQTVQGPASGIQVTHVFTTVGSVSVSATATDKDGGTSTAGTQTVTVVAAELQGGDLVVGGTTGDDHIVIQPADANGTVDVVVNGQDLGTFVPTGKVVVYGQTGNDLIEVVPLTAGDGSTTPLAVPVMLFGSDGDDTLDARGASGPVVLSGGAGNDTLWGGSGRNLLFGGSGSDVLHGGNADDLLIGGASTYDANVAALLTLQAEWNRTDADYLTRISDLNGTSGDGLNGTYVLNGLTVVDDAAVDSLFGNAGQDWFFAANGGANPDQVNDLEAGEQVTLL